MFPAIDKMLITDSSDGMQDHEMLTNYSMKMQIKNKKALQKIKNQRNVGKIDKVSTTKSSIENQ